MTETSKPSIDPKEITQRLERLDALMRKDQSDSKEIIRRLQRLDALTGEDGSRSAYDIPRQRRLPKLDESRIAWIRTLKQRGLKVRQIETLMHLSHGVIVKYGKGIGRSSPRAKGPVASTRPPQNPKPLVSGNAPMPHPVVPAETPKPPLAVPPPPKEGVNARALREYRAIDSDIESLSRKLGIPDTDRGSRFKVMKILEKWARMEEQGLA